MDGEEYNQGVETSGHGEDKDRQKEGDRCEKVYYICRQPESRASPMVSMPGGMNLCHDRMQKAFDSVTKGGMDFSKLPNMPYMNMNLNDLSMTPPAAEIPKKQRIKKGVKEQSVLTMKGISAPHVIKAKLDEYIIGQEKAKKVIVVATYNHYKGVFLDRPSKNAAVEDVGTDKNIVTEKSNILMIDPTGSGKTYLVRASARLLDVPLAIADATPLTKARYIGDNIENVVSRLFTVVGNDVGRAQGGIIFIDKTDKAVKRKQASIRDVSGESIQQGSLELLEGGIAEVPVGSNQKNAMTSMATVNTDNILSICGGIFSNLEKIIKERLMKKATMGFGSILKDTYNGGPDILDQVTNEDLRTFEMIPEFLGRSPMTVTLQGLTEDMMARILKEPKDTITKQYGRLLEMDEVRLVSEDEALKWITGETIKRGAGARALRVIPKEFMLDIMYEIPKDPNIGSVVVTRPYLGESDGLLIQMRG